MIKKEKLPLCKYARDGSYGMRCLVKCTVTGQLCGMIRWCPVNNCPRMGDKYRRSGCTVAMKEDFKKEKSKERENETKG